jgi:hypothetical protein
LKPAATNPDHHRAWGGLWERRLACRLTWRGWVLLTVLGLLGILFAVRGMLPFLAITNAHGRGVMIVEGWMPSFLVHEVATRYKAGSYSQLILARPLVRGVSKYESGEFTGQYVADALMQHGLSKDEIHVVFFEPGQKDRTFAGAVAVREWMGQAYPQPWTIDVVTLGPHARRSRLLFAKAFPEASPMGIIALEDESYDPEHWWRSSSGIREVPFEMLAYFYARIFFTPD